jgi:hypothetical protein
MMDSDTNLTTQCCKRQEYHSANNSQSVLLQCRQQFKCFMLQDA